MMLRNLIDEVRNRRVLAIAALGVLVALALPLLFLKSAPEGAPAAGAAAPAPAEEAKLPPRAARLLDASDAAGSRGATTGSARDPLAPPASYRAAIAAAAASGNGAAAGTSKPASSGVASTSPPTAKPDPTIGTSPPDTTTRSPSTSTTKRKAPALTTRNAAVDIRFGKVRDTRIRRAISRNQTFFVHGKLAAVFVKYSPARKKAVFAVAPNVVVTGAKCRNRDGVCRYVDLAPGEHAWLTMLMPSKTIVNRRLDVVRVKRTSNSRAGARAASSRSENACLLRKLQAAQLGDVVGRHACER